MEMENVAVILIVSKCRRFALILYHSMITDRQYCRFNFTLKRKDVDFISFIILDYMFTSVEN
jgi:hypothetical protein